VAAQADEELTYLWGRRNSFRLPFIVLGDLLSSRNLLKLLVKRDLNAQYRRAYLSYSWAILEPLLLTMVYTFLFTILLGSKDELYAVNVIIGVIAWRLFSRAVTTSTRSISGSINLFQFARIPKTVFATSSTLTSYVLALISLTSLIPFLYIHDLSVGVSALFIPFWLAIVAFTGWGIGLMLAPVACKIPDVINLVNFLVRAGFFLSPVMWTYDMFENRFGGGWHAYLAHLNPTIVPITRMRDAILGEATMIPEFGYWMCFGVAISAFILGSIVFEQKAHSAVVNV
jgi:ABC-type polysaccharide/polyol phosphate export permease